MKYVMMPLEVEAVQWTGTNVGEVGVFAGDHFNVLDPEDRANCDDPEATAEIYDQVHGTWVLTYDGDWVVKGIEGGFRPVWDEFFAAMFVVAE